MITDNWYSYLIYEYKAKVDDQIEVNLDLLSTQNNKVSTDLAQSEFNNKKSI